MITFDDGYYNNYLYAYPLLRQYNMKAVISVIGSQTDKYSKINNKNSYYAYLTWKDIAELSSSGYIEIQNHSYNMHGTKSGRRGTLQKYGESLEEYKAALYDDVGYMQDRLYETTGIRPTAFSYPLGDISKNSKDILKSIGIRSTFSCREGINYITRDPESLYRLKRVCRNPERSSAEFFKVIAPPEKKAPPQSAEQQSE